jgi:hypothetical protein
MLGFASWVFRLLNTDRTADAKMASGSQVSKVASVAKLTGIVPGPTNVPFHKPLIDQVF